MTTQRINVDLVPGTSRPSVQVSQGDHELRTIVVTLLSGGKKNVTIPTGATVEVRGTKPSGKGFNYGCTFSGDEVTIKVKDQMTAEPGRVRCEIVVETNSKEIGSSNFDMIVEASALQPGDVTSSDTFADLARKLVVNTEGNLFTNALKGFASGASVQVDDVSPLEHSPVVKVHGKNLIPFPYYDKSGAIHGVTYAVNEDGSVTAKGTATANAAFYLYRGGLDIKGTVFLSGCPSGGSISSISGGGFSLRLNKNVNGVEVTGGADVGNGNKIPLNGEPISVYIVALAGVTVDCTFYPMLEYGTVATDYEPWVDPTGFTVTDGNGNTFTPDTDGTVEGVTSTSPTMTLSLNKEGATIDVEYNRDLTAAIERIEAALFN